MDVRLPEVKGIHVQQALLRLDGKIHIYRKLLLTFREEYSTIYSRIANAAANEHYAEMDFLLHALRGASGNLSLYEVYDAATAIEKRLIKALNSTEQTCSLQQLLDQLACRLEETDHSISELLAFTN